MKKTIEVNNLLKTDSYKDAHWLQYPDGTQNVYSHFLSRRGARFPVTVWNGLQAILIQEIAGVFVTQEDIEETDRINAAHFGDPTLFNRKGWQRIVDVHGGKLPVRIKAAPEGLAIPTDNVLMTVEVTDDQEADWLMGWVTNYIESVLTHVWYPSTVASLSYDVRKLLMRFVTETGGDPGVVNYMLHDFGYRGATTSDAAKIGGAGHLISFFGSDTKVAIEFIEQNYDGRNSKLPIALSVVATEHSVMTALGRYAMLNGVKVNGDLVVLDGLFDKFPNGILSVVADSYDIYEFVRQVGRWKDRVRARNGKFVVRPDSTTPEHDTPAKLMVALLEMLWVDFGGTINDAGYRVLDPQIGILWGDGIDRDGIEEILLAMMTAGFAAENAVFGMGGGLLQKVNRDTQRFAFKCSAQLRNGEWVDISKDPLDDSKKSRAGRMKLIKVDGEYKTVRLEEPGEDILRTVFENGEVLNKLSFDEVRANLGALV